MTLRPHQIADMLQMVEYAFELGCDRVSLSGVCPAGRAISDKSLWMSRDEKKRFIETIFQLRKKYPPDFRIDTNDPLKCLVRGHSDVGIGDELVFDGCPAAAATFNVNANGDMTPCSLLNVPFMNIFSMSIEEMTEKISSKRHCQKHAGYEY
jgi:MoaA/NifB/PqqE/SkfB family radical SAM enzyme